MKLAKIFNSVEETLYEISRLNKRDFDKNLKQFKNLKIESNAWESVYTKMMFVAFYSGFRAETVNNKRNAIEARFGDLYKVAAFKEKDIQAALRTKDIIAHESKIRACVYNAKLLLELKLKHKTFLNYLRSIGDYNSMDAIPLFRKEFRKRFKYLGEITTEHFLTDIGFKTVKPDRVLCRILHRLGLTSSTEAYSEVIEVCSKMSDLTGYPYRYIDVILVMYGQVGYKGLIDADDGVCLEKKPKCEICKIVKYCEYYKNRK